jgi:nucleoid DNA-binding protein
METVKELGKRLEIKQKDAKDIMDTLCDIIVDNIDEVVALGSLGKFSMAKREAKTGRNPATGASVDIPAKYVPVFKFGAGTKKNLTVEV